MSIELYLFRHGRTTWNAAGRYQGHADVDLDDLGRGQALAVGQRCRSIEPVALYSSDLRRCADVGRQVELATGVELRLDDRLRERDVGLWSGLTRAEIKERFADEFEQWQHGDEEVKPGGGESAGDVIERIKLFVDTVRSDVGSGSVVAVTHAGWIRSMMQWVLGPGCARRNLGVPSQGSLTVLRIDDERLTLEAFNDRGHLLSVEPVDQEPPPAHIY